MALFADLILPLALPRLFTFGIPTEMESYITVGHRVTVTMGKGNKHYTGIVSKLHDQCPKSKTIKEITRILDHCPIVDHRQLQFWNWISAYYMCSLGEVMSAALPREIKTDTYAKKIEKYVILNPTINSESALNEALNSLKRAKAQYSTLIHYIELCGNIDYSNHTAIAYGKLSDTPTALKSLTSKGILLIGSREVNASAAAAAEEPVELTEASSAAAALSGQLCQQLSARHRTLLHESDDTATISESLQQLINKAVNDGRQVLYLIPEVSMSDDISERLFGIFGDRAIIYNSRQSTKSRAATYFRMLEEPDSVRIIIGTRASLFLPFANLGLIIIRDEHDSSYKQSDPAPRYNGRDTALILGRIHSADTLLCSRYPSTESLNNAHNKVFSYVKAGSISHHASGAALIRIRRGRDQFSKHLIAKLIERLEAGEQSLIFQNRRGFSPFIECDICCHIPRCKYCNVNMTYHKAAERLVCHYCGFTTEVPTRCPACGSEDIKPHGSGTQQTEEELGRLLPTARIARVDADNAASNRSALAAFANGDIDILVGTQMITRGIASQRLTLGAVINADTMLADPDFRTFERSFRTLRCLSNIVGGNEGRKYKEIIVQTNQTNHPVLVAAEYDDYSTIYRSGMIERQHFGYPPTVRFIRFTLRHHNQETLDMASASLGKSLRDLSAGPVLGPETPLVDRIGGQYIINFIQKLPRTITAEETKIRLAEIISRLKSGYKALSVVIDVDPM